MAKKDFGKRLIPEYLLKYSEDLHKNHPDPSASWGGGSEGGGDYTAGNGITITNNEISVDDTVVATKEELNGYIKNDDRTYTATFRGKGVVVNGGTVGISGGTGYGSSYYKYNSIQKIEPMKPTCDYSFPEKSGTFAMTSDIITSYNDLNDKPTIPDGATAPFLRLTDNNDTVFFSLTGAAQTFYKALDLAGQPPVHVNLHALNPVFGDGLTSTYNSSSSQLEVAVDTSVVALKSDIPAVPSTDNFVTTDTAQTITGIKTIGQNSGTFSEVDFSGFTFKLANKLINHPEADIKVRNSSYDGYQHPTIYSTKGLYVNLAKITLGDSGNNTYGITMPDSSTWESDRVLATTADIPAVPTVNDSTITFTQGGVTKGSFSLNQATNQTIELDAGGAQAPAFEITNMVVDSSAKTITLTITQNN